MASTFISVSRDRSPLPDNPLPASSGQEAAAADSSNTANDADGANVAPSSAEKGYEKAKGPEQVGPDSTGRQSKDILIPDADEPKPPSLKDEEEAAPMNESQTRRSSDTNAAPANTAGSTVGTRRQPNGTIGSVYSGNKLRHLKKDDGVPLWRKDIQYEFLRLVFADTTPVFTRPSDGARGMTFADIYVDTMAKSSKTSKILKEKLVHDRAAAVNMAMVCLLVNFGRINTTLNFFPEMRAQLRTYHSIPSLQARQDPNSYKQLQDAPRLKSILKGASEDTDQPTTIEKIKQLPVPRTNPVNLIFVLSQFAPRVSELHFDSPRDFFDLVMRATLSSQSRAKAFLWIMWYYLESDFSEEAALRNPFGAGHIGEGTDGLPLKVPEFEELTEEQADAENVDTPDEIRFGEEKQQERKRILEDDEPAPRVTKRSRKAPPNWPYSDDEASAEMPEGSSMLMASHPGLADTASRRSSLDDRGLMAATPLNASMRRDAPDDDGWQTPITGSRGGNKRSGRDSSTHRPSHQRQPQRIILKAKPDQTPDLASPAPGAPNPFETDSPSASQYHNWSSSRRNRPLTQHQLAVEQHRKQSVDYLLSVRRAETLKAFRAHRQSEGLFIRAGRLMHDLPNGYDSADENSWGKGGICPNPDNEEDFGEAAGFYLSVIRKAMRRLRRWDWDSMVEDSRAAENGIEAEPEIGASHNGYYEPPRMGVPPPPPPRPRNRGGKRKSRAADETVDETEQPQVEKSKRSRQRASTTGRSRASAGGSSKKPRASGRASKLTDTTEALKQEARDDEHLSVPTPSRDVGHTSYSSDVETSRVGDDTADNVIRDDVRSERGGGGDSHQSRILPSTASHTAEGVPTVSLTPAVDRVREQEGDDDSVREGLSSVQGHGDETEDEDVDMDSSIYGGRNDDVDVASESSGDETEAEPGRDDDGDETMVDG